jgi:hypothetical protein
MFRSLLMAAAAALFLCVSSASPARAQVVQLSEAAAERAERSIAAATRANMRAAELASALDVSQIEGATTPEAFVAGLDRMAPQIAAARSEIASLRRGLLAQPAVGGGPDAPIQLRAIDQLVSDSIGFLVNVDAMLAAYTDVADGFRSGDQTKALSALRTLSGAAMTLIDGQALMMRGRGAMFGSDRSDYFQAEGIACLYDGMAATLRAQLTLIEPADASAKLATAQSCVERQVEGGKAALVREAGSRSRNQTARALEERMAELSGRIFDSMSRGAAILGEAHAVLKSGGGDPALQAVMDRFVVFEQELAALGQEQGAALVSRGPA